MIRSVAAALAFAAACHASPRPTTVDASPPEWPLPDGWKAENIPFPLEFAPELAHRGVEVIRFMPGFFDPQAPGYWSYAFVWWLEDRAPQRPDELAAELVIYFRGLSLAVGGKKFAMDPAHFAARLDARLEGQAELYDAFKTGLPLKLGVRAAQLDCPRAGRRAVLMMLSPQPRGSTVWLELAARRAEFHCE